MRSTKKYICLLALLPGCQLQKFKEFEGVSIFTTTLEGGFDSLNHMDFNLASPPN